MAFRQALHALGIPLGFLAQPQDKAPKEGWAASMARPPEGLGANLGRNLQPNSTRGSGGSIENNPMNRTDTRSTKRFVSRLVNHGASLVSLEELVAEAQIIWRIRSDQEVSKACLHAEEFMASAARNCRRAMSVMDRMGQDEGRRDADLVTALKKYVEDTCEAIKQVDNELKRYDSSLETLLFEIPGQSDEQISWRNLVGRRDVIAHQLLTVDDRRVYREAERDFYSLQEFISRVYFAPVKTNLRAGRGATPLLRTEVLNRLTPVVGGERPRVGTSLVFVFEDVGDGFLCIRMGRTEKNKIALQTPRPMYFSIAGVEGMENVKDDQDFRETILAARKKEQGTFVYPKVGTE